MSTAITVAQAQTSAITLGLERLDTQLLRLHVVGQPASARAWLLAHDTDLLTPTQQQRFAQLTQRRASGEPLAYITGCKEFFGLSLRVDARVLLPRPDTEALVQWVLDVLPPPSSATPHPAIAASASRVLDLGCGSGAIALAVKHERRDVDVGAVDFSADALDVARENARQLRLDIRFEQGSWLAQVQGQFHVIASNPPYISDADPHLQALSHEPRQALTSGADGLDDLRQIIDQAPCHLEPGGWLLLEHGYNQADAVRALLRAQGFTHVQSRQDIAGIERCSGGQWQTAG